MLHFKTSMASDITVKIAINIKQSIGNNKELFQLFSNFSGQLLKPKVFKVSQIYHCSYWVKVYTQILKKSFK